MKDDIIICECGSAEHQLVLHFDDDKDLGRQIFVEVHLVPLVWYKRLWQGLKYIFGYKCCYGNFEEIILTSKHLKKLRQMCRFLSNSDRQLISPDEFKQIVGDNPCNQVTEINCD